MTEPNSQAPVKQVHVENSYIVDAKDYGKEFVFKDYKVKAVIGTLLRERLDGKTYDPVTGTQMAEGLTNELRDRVAALGYARHKLIVQVTFCQHTGQAMRAASRCLWDPTNDGSACDSFENDTLMCTCQVYGLYLD